ncbi:MAG TPA: helix-turn-helix domain-containing protein, partial [Gaiellaceae bacterium]|nr:helix-turn-helix domain-containing protein [Gaiellaceae bacterium]
KRSQEHLDARRAEILDGAKRCFSRHGYAGATVARLEEEIGLSRGAIFNYFPSKQDLFIAVAVDVSSRYGDTIFDGGLEAAVRAMAAEDPEYLGMLMEVQGQMRHDEEFVRKFEAAAEAVQPQLADWFESQQRAGVFRDDVPSRELGRFATMVLNGLALRVVGGDPTDVDATLKLLEDALAPRK